jgi:integrase/recombinase XerD
MQVLGQSVQVYQECHKGMRVGEALNLIPRDLNDQKPTIQNPKSGKDAEVVFIPRKVVERLRTYF